MNLAIPQAYPTFKKRSLRVIYSQALRKLVSDDIRQQKLSNLKNSFQNLIRAEKIIQSDLGWALMDKLTPPDREFAEMQFAKRHVITHNLDLVDERFGAQAHTWQQAGQDIEISVQDVTKLLTLVEETLRANITELDGIQGKS